MSPQYYKSKSRLGDLLDNYGAEGISVLCAEPSRMMRAIILVLLAFIACAVVWAFIGKADVLVKASGSISPEAEQYKVQTPMKGELIDIYVSEGMPVTKGDILARVYSPQAIQVAAAADTAKGLYEKAKQAFDEFPEQRLLRERELAILKSRLDAERVAQQKLEAEAIAQLGDEQALKLKKVRTKLSKADDARKHAKSILESHQRLFTSEGGGGISKSQLTEKRNDYKVKQLDYELALAELGEFEVSLSKVYNKKRTEIEKRAQQLLSLQTQYESTLLQIDKDERAIEIELRISRSTYLSSSRVTFDDIDEDNNLRLRSPMDGIVTKTLIEQTGIIVEDKAPILVLAPENSRRILEVLILERDRGFLRVGMRVQVKVNAFSYQRYGLLHGELEYISPSTSSDPQSKQDYYTARVGLDKDYFSINGEKTPIRYGMKAQAEITVRKRRIIDLVLDPIRNIAG